MKRPKSFTDISITIYQDAELGSSNAPIFADTIESELRGISVTVADGTDCDFDVFGGTEEEQDWVTSTVRTIIEKGA
jgi:hypothetical protein